MEVGIKKEEVEEMNLRTGAKDVQFHLKTLGKPFTTARVELENNEAIDISGMGPNSSGSIWIVKLDGKLEIRVGNSDIISEITGLGIREKVRDL